VRGVWDLIVACKGSVVVAWRRGSLRTGLVGIMAAAVMVGAVAALWLVAGGDGAGRDAGAPADRTATPEPRVPDDDTTGRERAEASELMRRGSPGRGAWSAEAIEKAAAVSGSPADGSGVPGSTSDNGEEGPAPQTAGAASSGPRSVPPAAGPQRGVSPGTSAPTTTSPAPPDAPASRATTTTTAAPPPGGTGAGDGAGGLLGGLLDVLGLG
jgi:hypothetical protein